MIHVISVLCSERHIWLFFMKINKSSDLKKARAVTLSLTKLKQVTAAPEDGPLSSAWR